MAQNEYLVDGADMTTVANAIREKGGTTAPLSFPNGMAAAVRNIQSGGDLSLGITGAQVGQIAKITAVDTDGKPTKWEPVDIPSGGTDISLGLTAAVGQTIKVKAVDTDGKPTAWEAVDMAGDDLSWIEVADITTEEQTQQLIISTDKDGRPISQYNALEMIFSIQVPADATQTSSNGNLWIYPYPKYGESTYRYIANIATWKTIERTFTCMWAGLPRVLWLSAWSAQTIFNMHNTNGDADFMSGLCVYVNQSGDHIPAGTKVRIAVLSKGVTA